MTRVLIVLTAAPEGFAPADFLAAHHCFLEHGFQVDVATPAGRPATPAPGSLDPDAYGGDRGHALNIQEQLYDIESWQRPLSLDRLALTGQRHDALFFPGGPGVLQDLASSRGAASLIKRCLASGALLGASGSGVAAFRGASHDNAWLLAGYRIAGPAEPEDPDFHRAGASGWLQELGARLDSGPAGNEHVAIDRGLYTAQNSASAPRVVWEMARRLKKAASLDKAACGTPCG